ncbi:MAG: helicase-related protein [Acidiferrobacter sp.]
MECDVIEENRRDVMSRTFQGWERVAANLRRYADEQDALAKRRGESVCRLNLGQRASLRAIADRVPKNGLVVADEVGMGKTRIAVELARSVIEADGRVAILVPPGLGYQWRDELHDGKVEAPLILRSLRQYLDAWRSMEIGGQEPWFKNSVVLISHAFTNWRLGPDSAPWRWALLPEFYAQWRQSTQGRLPRSYHDSEVLEDEGVRNAARSICNVVRLSGRESLAYQWAAKIDEETPWPGALDAEAYGREQQLRHHLERVVGLGLGIFDLVVIDEAHKNRGEDSSLSRLLDRVVLTSACARKVGVTATPIELDVNQWQHTLGRIGINESSLAIIKRATEGYAQSVKYVRQCPSSQETRERYRNVAAVFQAALSPFLLRRDKREDPVVQLFAQRTGLPMTEYRRETAVTVETLRLPFAWKQAVCAAEALSAVTHLKEDSVAKRLRLTLANGHGLSAFMDQVVDDEAQNLPTGAEAPLDKAMPVETKHGARVNWWLKVMRKPFGKGVDPLFDHPAILAAVNKIEQVTGRNEKVLVFGRFTRPLRALVDLLNAREMLRCLDAARPWPQAKMHEDDGLGHREESALRAALQQLNCNDSIEGIAKKLAAQYGRIESQRRKERRTLIADIGEGFRIQDPGKLMTGLFAAFQESAKRSKDESGQRHPLTLVSKAISELIRGVDVSAPSDLAGAFTQLVEALRDREEDDKKADDEYSEGDVNQLWAQLEERLHEEYNRPEGGFARLMFGGTKAESRRVLQLAFNRQNSFPKVLVSQSMVGREGLNLHKACRTVILLHPEWNPGVVEQQIGRVDRVSSYWAALMTAAERHASADEIPRIEVCPVIFKGTYDELHWKVLQARWDDLRAQLHGTIIPAGRENNGVPKEIINEINNAAPSFSPVGNR